MARKSTGKDAFGLTDEAVRRAASVTEGEASPRIDEKRGRTAESARRARRTAGRKLATRPKSVVLYEDQQELVRDLEYRSRGAVKFSRIAREALDEYLIAHGGDLGMTVSEIEELRATARS